MSSRDDRVDELYAGSSSDFVKRRNALAKELKTEGAGDAADQVSGLKKPTAAAWALNQGVRDDAAAAKALAKAGKDLAAAQAGVLEGKRGARERMRKAKAAEDEAVERLVGAVVTAARGDKPSGAMLERVRETLRAVATDEQVASEVAAGRVVADHRAVGLGGDLAAALAASPRKGKPGQDKRRKREVAKAEKTLDEAKARLERARDDLGAAQQSVTRAKSAVSDAEGEVVAAERDLRRAGNSQADA
jgi:hypothetical protein